jgi:NAD(P)-dependent dehydrogenase (short-subunit alcohol dehydrogenase family)
VLLDGKNAVIYGGGGTIGGAVARAFAREGATVHLAGRSADKLERVAGDIGDRAHTAVVDALDELAVGAHAQKIVDRHGSLDISFNLISHGDVQGTPLVDMTIAELERPVHTALRTMFITARAAARHMIDSGDGGTILVFGGYGDPMTNWNLGGLQVAFAAQEQLRRNLAAELGRHGIRVVTLQTGGILESIPETVEQRDQIVRMTEEQTLLGRAATLADVGNVAAFAASDKAASITATQINITCGTQVD